MVGSGWVMRMGMGMGIVGEMHCLGVVLDVILTNDAFSVVLVEILYPIH